MNSKQAFIHELNPLLKEAEQAILENNVDEKARLIAAVLELVSSYSTKLSKKQLRDALNNPTATAILKRLKMKLLQ